MSLAKEIEDVLKDCLYKEEELIDAGPPPDAIIVDGIMSKFALHPGRIAANKEKIAAFCNQMADEFQRKKGGGWTFLNLCMTKEGVQWGEHHNCEQLVVLAIASDQGCYPLPRMLWQAMPGGMPYVQFDTSA